MNPTQTKLVFDAAQQRVLEIERELKQMMDAFTTSAAAIKGHISELREALRAPEQIDP